MLVNRSQLPAESTPRQLRASSYNMYSRNDDTSLVVVNTLSGAAVTVPPSLADESFAFLARSEPFATATLPAALDGLRSAGFFCDASADEARQARLVRGLATSRADHLELFLLPTEQCDFRCVYCYEDFKIGMMTPKVRAGVLNLVRARVPKLSSLLLHWFGGEPLQGLEVIRELGPKIRDLAVENDCWFRCHITTNGYSLTEEIASELLDGGVTSFQITLDGPREEHDERRRLHESEDGDSGTFDRILANVERLLALQRVFSLTLRVNYDRDSLPAIPDFIRFLGQRFASDPRVRVDFAAIWANPDEVPVSLCAGREKQRTAVEFFELAHEVGLNTDLAGAYAPGALVCYAARANSFVIRANGAVNKCTVALDADYNHVGRLDEAGRMDLDLDRLALWTGSGIEEDAVCQGCWFGPSCQGNACPLERIENERRPCPTPKTFGRRVLKIID